LQEQLREKLQELRLSFPLAIAYNLFRGSLQRLRDSSAWPFLEYKDASTQTFSHSCSLERIYPMMTTAPVFPPQLALEALVRVDGISKTITSKAGQTVILDNISLTVPAGSLFSINGPSGSGKSTLLNIMTGIDRPTTGRILFAGQEIRKMSENQLAKWRSKHVGIVFQFFQLLPTLTAQENILLAMELGGTIPRRQWRERSLECLSQVGLADYSRRLPSELSGGQQQRVAIARALVNNPPVLVADEPTGNLDSKTALQIFDLLAELTRRDKTVIYVTHDRDLAARSTHRIDLLDGRILTPTGALRLARLEKQGEAQA
jgi:putative ABC transport system ATP-binding protein